MRLTDLEIKALLCVTTPVDAKPELKVLDMALAEIVERRAADENLRRLSDVIRGYYNRRGGAPTSTTIDLCDAIDKLLGMKP